MLVDEVDVKRIAAVLGIDTSYNLRVVGDRLEFHLLGGRVLVWPCGCRGTAADPPAPDFLLEKPDRASTGSATGALTSGAGQVSGARPADLLSMSRDELRDVAAAAGIPGRGRMSKTELVDAIEAVLEPRV